MDASILEERKTMNRLLEMLKVGGKSCSDFRSSLSGFLRYARKYEKEKLTGRERIMSNCYHLGLLCFARNYRGNELVEATMQYLNVRYLKLIESFRND